jgi:hypothetical protein
VRSIEHVAPQAGSRAGRFNLQLVKGIEPAVDLDATQMTSQQKNVLKRFIRENSCSMDECSSR